MHAGWSWRHDLRHGDRHPGRRADLRRDCQVSEPDRPRPTAPVTTRSLNIPAGTYPSMDASKPGIRLGFGRDYRGDRRQHDHARLLADRRPDSACLTDTTQADFLTGVLDERRPEHQPRRRDAAQPIVDQQNTAGTTTGTGFGTPAWTGQTFIPAITGQPRAKRYPSLLQRLRSYSSRTSRFQFAPRAAGLPTGADLARATIPGSCIWERRDRLYTATFGVAGNSDRRNAIRSVSCARCRSRQVPAISGFVPSPSTYANGSRVLSADSGGTWTR